ncbi:MULTISPECIES: hypothetical protein [Pseudomonas syringae group]|nr:hypothetical protein [Pseudomonas syringae group genomosp. 7]
MPNGISVAPTEAGAKLMERILPALGEVESALDVTAKPSRSTRQAR